MHFPRQMHFPHWMHFPRQMHFQQQIYFPRQQSFPSLLGAQRAQRGAGTPKPGSWKRCLAHRESQNWTRMPRASCSWYPFHGRGGASLLIQGGTGAGNNSPAGIRDAGSTAQAATLGELGHRFPPPPAFPRMLQQSSARSPGPSGNAHGQQQGTRWRQSPAFQLRSVRRVLRCPAHPQWGQLTPGPPRV